MAAATTNYTGHCSMSNQEHILEFFKAPGPDKQEPDELSRDKLSTGISQVVGDMQDVVVSVYLAKFPDPITVLTGNGENTLDIRFLEGGEIKYEWIARSLKEISKTFVGNFAKKISGATIEALVNIKSELENKDLLAEGIKELAWKK